MFYKTSVLGEKTQKQLKLSSQFIPSHIILNENCFYEEKKRVLLIKQIKEREQERERGGERRKEKKIKKRRENLKGTE
jgi:hypothetical protein